MNDQGQGINNEPGLTETQVIRLAQSSRWKNKLIAAQNSGCPPAILDELAHQKRHSDELQRAVAGHRLRNDYLLAINNDPSNVD